MKNDGIIETNIKLHSKNRVNIELALLLDKIRSVIAARGKETLTVNIDNTSGLLMFEFLINDNEVPHYIPKNTFTFS